MFQLGSTPIDWTTGAKVLSRQTKDTKGIIAFARTELEAKGPEALLKEGQSMPQYAITRSLFIEVWFALAASRAEIFDPVTRRAIGLVYSSTNVDSEKNAFTVFGNFLQAALTGPVGGVSAIVGPLIDDLKAVQAGLTEEDRGKVKASSKTGYDSSLTEGTLRAVAAAAEAAVASLPAAPLPPFTVAPLMMPPLRASEKGDFAPAAPAAAKPKSGGFGARLLEAKQKLPDFAAMLKKQQRPSFVELNSWVVGDDRVTCNEAVSLLLDFTLRAREKLGAPLLLVVPGDFMASTVTLGTRKLSNDIFVMVVGEPLPEGIPQGTLGILAAFNPAPVDGMWDGPAGVKTMKALRDAGMPVVIAAVTRVPSTEVAVDGKERVMVSEKVATWAEPAFGGSNAQ